MSEEDRKEQRVRETGRLVAGGLFALVAGAAITLSWTDSPSDPLWFVGLLVVFAASLALVAMAFRWQGMASTEEPFALPAGSMRMLLAIGIMVLFTVFGLAALDVTRGQRSVAEGPPVVAVAPGEAAALAAEVKRLQDQGFAVVVAARTGEGAAAQATLNLYRPVLSKPQDTVDMQKQLLTALVTLLTTVIGFYFGSRSSAEAAKAAGGAGGGDARKAELEPLSADLQRFDGDLQDAAGRLSTLAGATPKPGNETAFAAAMAAAQAEAPQLQSERDALGTALAAAREKGEPLTPVRQQLDALRQRLDALRRSLGEAEKLVAEG